MGTLSSINIIHLIYYLCNNIFKTIIYKDCEFIPLLFFTSPPTNGTSDAAASITVSI